MKKQTFVQALLLAAMISTGGQAYAQAQLCGPGDQKTGDNYRVNGTGIDVHKSPNAKSEKIVNEKASKIFKKTMFITIDKSVTVQELCRQGSWSYIQVAEPASLSDSHKGWVQTSALRKNEVDKAGKEIFTDPDFSWRKETLPYKDVVIAGVNKIHRENESCKTISPSSASIVPSKGTKADPVFFVTCGTGKKVFNVFFSKSDIEKGVSMAAPAHTRKSVAMQLCEDYARDSATNPDSVKLSRVMDMALEEAPNGITKMASTFTTKNNRNQDMKYRIFCNVQNGQLLDAKISK